MARRRRRRDEEQGEYGEPYEDDEYYDDRPRRRRSAIQEHQTLIIILVVVFCFGGFGGVRYMACRGTNAVTGAYARNRARTAQKHEEARRKAAAAEQARIRGIANERKRDANRAKLDESVVARYGAALAQIDTGVAEHRKLAGHRKLFYKHQGAVHRAKQTYAAMERTVNAGTRPPTIRPTLAEVEKIAKAVDAAVVAAGGTRTASKPDKTPKPEDPGSFGPKATRQQLETLALKIGVIQGLLDKLSAEITALEVVIKARGGKVMQEIKDALAAARDVHAETTGDLERVNELKSAGKTILALEEISYVDPDPLKAKRDEVKNAAQELGVAD